MAAKGAAASNLRVVGDGQGNVRRRAALALVQGHLPKSPEAVVQLTQLTQELRDEADSSRYLLGGILAKLFEGDRWKEGDAALHAAERAASEKAGEKCPEGDEPCANFGAFCRRHVGLVYRTCLYLISMYRRAVDLGLSAKKIAEVGWTKARMFLRVARADDLESWIERAKTMTASQMDLAVRDAIHERKEKDQPAAGEPTGGITARPSSGTGGPRFERREKLSVDVTQDEAALINETIDRAAEMLAARPGMITSRGHALQLICTEFALNHIDDEAQALSWYKKRMEERFGVKLEIVGTSHPGKAPGGNKKKAG